MKLSKVRTAEEIIARFKDGQIIAIGGQTNQYMPDRLIDCVLESGAQASDHLLHRLQRPGPRRQPAGGGRPGGRHDHHPRGHQPPDQRQNPVRGAEGGIQPHGHLHRAHPLRRRGAGRRAHKTGLGTVVEEGKQIIEVNGESYLLETALRADIALTRCRRADPLGNLAYSGSSGHASHP